MIKITVQLFGHFRRFGDCLSLELPEGSRIADLQRIFTQTIEKRDPAFYEYSALRSSRFCDDTMILSQEHSLADGGNFSILPPVSGG